MTFPVVGVVGAGQLARMMQPAAVALGVRLRVLGASPHDSAALVVPDHVVGDHTDLDTLRRFAAGCDVLTLEHEHVPTEHLEALERDGVAVRPGSGALRHAQDKGVMRAALSAAGIPCPRWALVHDERELATFGDDTGWPVVVKTPRGGYDGRGVLVAERAQDASAWFGRGGALIAEELVPFTRELAAVVARSPHGQAVAYPVVETVQREGICREVVAPAPVDEQTAIQAQDTALRIAGALGVTGILAVELFQTRHGVLVNELAMRPHNSGHWSIDGAVTSQFENHLRAVLDLPLGDPAALAPRAVMANVLGGDYPEMYPAYRHVLARDPAVRVHMYAKDVRPGRKVGHVTVLGRDTDQLLERARHAAAYLRGEITE